VCAVSLTAEWMAWVAALAAPLHDRLAWRLADVVLGILLASRRRTAVSKSISVYPNGTRITQVRIRLELESSDLLGR